MKKYLKVLTLIPLLMLAVACSGGGSDNSSDTGDDTSTTQPPVTPDPNTPTDPTTPPANPTPHLPLEKVGNPAHLITESPSEILETAFTNHASSIYDGWAVASAGDQEAVVEMVKEAWDEYLGYEDLDSFKAALKADTINTLNKFLQFEAHTILSASDLYKSKKQSDTVAATLLNEVGDYNQAALQHLKGAYTAKDMPQLEAFGGQLDSSNVFDPKGGDLYKLSIASYELSLFIVKVAGCYSIQDYFTDVDSSDSRFETLVENFMIPPDDSQQLTLPAFITINMVDQDIYPYNTPDVCNSNPSCKAYKDEGVAIVTYMGQALPELLQRISFTYTDEGGTKHHWSFFNFENVAANGQMIMARGRFGANETKDVIFVKESEFTN